MSEWNELRADASALRDMIEHRWTKLTAADLDRIAWGDRDVLVRTIEERYGLSREQAEHAVLSFVERDRPPTH